MDLRTNTTAQKLLRSFMMLRHLEWHPRSIAGYKPSEIKVLLCIKRGTMPVRCEGGEAIVPPLRVMTVSEISKRLHVTSPTVTQLLKNLEAHDLIERHIDPTDRRTVGITLTEKGLLVSVEAMRAFADSIDGLVEYLGEEQSNQLADLMFKMFTYYHEKATSMHELPWNGEEDA